VLKAPIIERLGRNKMRITNFLDICKQLNRHPDHLLGFITAETGREGSMCSQGASKL